MRPSIDPDSFGFLVADVSRLLRAATDRRIAEAGIGLTEGEGRTLAHAARAGMVRQTALADRMGVEAMTLSGYLDRLEGRGLVERRPDPDDRRAKLVQLTIRGEEVLAEVLSLGAEVRTEAARDVDPAAWTTVLAALRQVRDNLCETRAAQSKRENAAA